MKTFYFLFLRIEKKKKIFDWQTYFLSFCFEEQKTVIENNY